MKELVTVTEQEVRVRGVADTILEVCTTAVAGYLCYAAVLYGLVVNVTKTPAVLLAVVVFAVTLGTFGWSDFHNSAEVHVGQRLNAAGLTRSRFSWWGPVYRLKNLLALLFLSGGVLLTVRVVGGPAWLRISVNAAYAAVTVVLIIASTGTTMVQLHGKWRAVEMQPMESMFMVLTTILAIVCLVTAPYLVKDPQTEFVPMLILVLGVWSYLLKVRMTSLRTAGVPSVELFAVLDALVDKMTKDQEAYQKGLEFAAVQLYDLVSQYRATEVTQDYDAFIDYVEGRVLPAADANAETVLPLFRRLEQEAQSR